MNKTLQQLYKQREELNQKIAKEESKKVKWTKIGNLEWSENLGKMDWYEAKKKCEKLGGRLPTRVELLDLYDNHHEKCVDWSNYYWSSTEYSDTYAWYQNFSTGTQHNNTKTNTNCVRCVR